MFPRPEPTRGWIRPPSVQSSSLDRKNEASTAAVYEMTDNVGDTESRDEEDAHTNENEVETSNNQDKYTSDDDGKHTNENEGDTSKNEVLGGMTDNEVMENDMNYDSMGDEINHENLKVHDEVSADDANH